MPGKYGKIAERIAKAGAEESLSPADIGKIISECGPGIDLPRERDVRDDERRPIGGGSPSGGGSSLGVNLYPGTPCDTCYDLAVFVAIEGRLRRPYSRGHLSFDKMLAEFRRHFDICPHTREAVIITDTWHAPTYDRWRVSIERVVGAGVYLEVYLVAPGWSSELFIL